MKKLITLILLAAASSAFAASPYVGASAGYLIDAEEEFFAVRIGSDIAQVKGLTHSIEGEIGYVGDSEGGLSLDLVPVMGNYRISTQPAANNVSFYAGAGLGISRVKLSGWLNDDDWAFTVQGFAGVEYKVTPALSLNLGARYIWLDDVSIGGASIDLGDD
ncbi:MAG TPA: outer membrane beta-barrel protein, partial [Opitutus sp.]|nr:outer membrane beta-barrel protein [Opitutus sp.]